MSRRQQLMRPHHSILLPPEVPVFWIETNQPGQVDYYVDANPGSTPTLYRIQYSTTSTFDEGTVQEVTTASTGYQSLYLPPGVEYYFQARAERDDLTSSWTGVTGGTVPALLVEQSSADSDYAYANWSTIPLAEGYSYDIDGGGFNFTTDISLSVACAPGQTLTLSSSSDESSTPSSSETPSTSSDAPNSLHSSSVSSMSSSGSSASSGPPMSSSLANSGSSSSSSSFDSSSSSDVHEPSGSDINSSSTSAPGGSSSGSGSDSSSSWSS